MGKKAGIGEFSAWIHPKSQNPGAAPRTGADFFTPSLFFLMEKNDFSQDSRLENSQFFIKNPEFRAFYAEEIVECRAGREFFPGYSQGSSHFPLLHIFLRKSCFLPLQNPRFLPPDPPWNGLIPGIRSWLDLKGSQQFPPGFSKIPRGNLGKIPLHFPLFPWVFPFSPGITVYIRHSLPNPCLFPFFIRPGGGKPTPFSRFSQFSPPPRIEYL